MIKKTTIIIGGSSEIGIATAKKLLEKDINLALTYNTNNLDLTEIKNTKNAKNKNNESKQVEKTEQNAEIKKYKLNLQKNEEIESFFEQVDKDFSYVDTLIFCAGVAQKRALIMDVKDTEIDNLFNVNIKSAIKCIKEFTKLTVNKHPANIVLVGSFVEKFGCSCESVYTATKSALSGLCKSLANELGNLDVRINVVAPGFIDTKMNNNLTTEEKDDIAEMTPLKRLGTSKDIANAIAFFASEDASFITGQTLFVDGGLILE